MPKFLMTPGLIARTAGGLPQKDPERVEVGVQEEAQVTEALEEQDIDQGVSLHQGAPYQVDPYMVQSAILSLLVAVEATVEEQAAEWFVSSAVNS